jgi:hypothetical protein
LASFAAVLGGNFSSNGTAAVAHSFGLFWCGTGYAETGSCTGRSDGDDVVFGYVGNPIDSNISQLQNFASAHPDWVATIESEALKAFKSAFSSYPITMHIGSTHFQGGTQVRDQEFGQYVVGHWPTPSTGKSFPLSGSSNLYYLQFMGDAQAALGSPVGQYPNCGQCRFQPTYQTPLAPGSLPDFQLLVKTIGKAIGNAAAHETGHLLEVIHPNGGPGFQYMDCGLANPDPNGAHACENGDNFVYNFFFANGVPQSSSDPSGGQFFYIDPPGHTIHWGPTNKCWLTTYATPGSKCQ